MRKQIQFMLIGTLGLTLIACGGAEDEDVLGGIGLSEVGAESGVESPNTDLEAAESQEEAEEETPAESGETVDEETPVEEEITEAPVEEEEEQTAVEGGAELEEVEVVDGIPAPGSICPIPEPWGYKVGENLKNMAFQNCAGEYITMYDAACGAAVSWVYFTYGW